MFPSAVGLCAHAIRQGTDGCQRIRNLIAIVADIHDPPSVIRSELLPGMVLRCLVKYRLWRSFRIRRKTVVEGPNFWARSRRRGCLLCFARPVNRRFRALIWSGWLWNGDRARSNGRNILSTWEESCRANGGGVSRRGCCRYKNQFQRGGDRGRRGRVLETSLAP